MPTTGQRRHHVVGESLLKKYIANCHESELIDEVPPVLTNYLDDPNPHKAKGGESWEMEIYKSRFYIGFCCVTDPVEHMMTKTAEFLEGTKHKTRGMSTTMG